MDVVTRSLRPTAGQRALVEKLARGEPSLGSEIRTLSAQRYLDPARFQRERDRLFAARPLLIGPSALLPAPRTMLTHDGDGVPLILTRDEHGVVHALANVCRHRGARLVDSHDEAQPCSRMICPYHAWTYGADGALLALPRMDSFPGLERSAHGLRRFPVIESAGLIWVGLTSAVDFADVVALEEDLDRFALAPMHLYARKTHRVAANWKLLVDAFLESYHVQRLHASTIANFFTDGLTAADCIGPHQRAIVGRHDNLATIDRDDWGQLRKAVTFTYQLFPNAVLVVSPDYINILIIRPVSLSETLVEDQMLIARPPGNAKAEDHWRRSWDLLDGEVFGREDFGAAERNQRGLQSGLIEALTLGTLETGIADWHDRVDRFADQPSA